MEVYKIIRDIDCIIWYYFLGRRVLNKLHMGRGVGGGENFNGDLAGGDVLLTEGDQYLK